MNEIGFIGVMIVSNNQSLTSDMVLQINSISGIRCVSTAEDVESVLRLIPATDPGVALIDLETSGRLEPDDLRSLRNSCPTLRLIVLKNHPEISFVLGGIRAGVSGFLPRNHTIEELEKAIRLVCLEGCYFTPASTKAVFYYFRDWWEIGDKTELLSAREQDVMTLLIDEKLDKEIASELRIGEGSVHTYVGRIYKKLGVHSRREAIKKYLGISLG